MPAEAVFVLKTSEFGKLDAEEEEEDCCRFGADADRTGTAAAEAGRDALTPGLTAAAAAASRLRRRERLLPLLWRPPLLASASSSSDMRDIMWFIEWFRSWRSSIAERNVGERGCRRMISYARRKPGRGRERELGAKEKRRLRFRRGRVVEGSAKTRTGERHTPDLSVSTLMY